jgi:hypothetical protein
MSGRSIWALLGGVLFTVVVTTLVDLALHAAGVYGGSEQPLGNGLAALALSYRIVIGIGGGWLTAVLAPRRPVAHALALGVVGAALGAIGAVVTWDKGLGPHWYSVSLAILAIPQCWLGGTIFDRSGVAADRSESGR